MGGSRVSRISSVALQSLHQAFKMICTYPTFLTDVEINMFPASLPSLKQHSIYHSAPRAHFPNSDNKKSPKPSEGKINPHPRLCKSPSTAMNKRRINPEKKRQLELQRPRLSPSQAREMRQEAKEEIKDPLRTDLLFRSQLLEMSGWKRRKLALQRVSPSPGVKSVEREGIPRLSQWGCLIASRVLGNTGKTAAPGWFTRWVM